MFPSYQSHSADVVCKSTDWFLYDEDINRILVKNGVMFTSPKLIFLQVGKIGPFFPHAIFLKKSDSHLGFPWRLG